MKCKQIQMKNSSSPKKVSIYLQSPDKANKVKKSPSPPKKQIYKQSISKLKKTFNDGPNVYEHIKMQHDRKIKQIQKTKIKQKIRNDERILDQQNRQPISQQLFNLCIAIFGQLDKSNKKYTQITDLQHLRNRNIIDIVKVVYVRKEKSSLFDFIYALWDSGCLKRLRDDYKNKL